MEILITSFDIGSVNFAYYSELVNLCKFNKLRKKYVALKNPQKKSQHNFFVNKVCKIGKRVSTGVISLSDIILCNDTTSDEKFMCKKGVYSEESRRKLLQYLNSNEGMWNESGAIVIEQQFFATFGHKKLVQVNMNAIKIAEDVMMYFMIKFPDKLVCIFSAALKTSVLCCPKKLSKIQRKKWACEKSYEIYTKRSDKEAQYAYELCEKVKRKRKLDGFINEYENFVKDKDILKLCEKIVKEKQKLDDTSDALVQLQAFKFKKMLCD